MNKLHILTPVKDSLEIALKTINSVVNSDISVDFSYTVYNDFSKDENTEKLKLAALEFGFELVNLNDITMHPSPNYLMILQVAQNRANFEGAHLLIIESDVIVEKNTIQQMYDSLSSLENPGLIASVTTDSNKKINYPYLYAKRFKKEVVNTKKRLSFCCALLTQSFLTSYNFDTLNPESTWFDYFITSKSMELGFKNYLVTSLPVIHLQHSIYPWMHLKHSHPFVYYWKKLVGKF
jgi:hypothetical protein